jgi:hypothetical protein
MENKLVTNKLVTNKLVTNNYIENKAVRDWLEYNPYRALKNQILRKKAEDSWGKSVTGKNSVQWTTTLSETIFKEYLESQRAQIIKKKIYKSSEGKKLKPDFETETALYEIKCRTWNTPGTAGEKILGVPYKYSELPRLSGKPLYIVLMAYQEKEDFGLFSTSSPEKKELIEYWRSKRITFVKFTDLIKG